MRGFMWKRKKKTNMAKFKSCQKCRVIKNLLSPENVGQVVVIIRVADERDGRVLYEVMEDGLHGYASEDCLELIDM